MNPQDKSDAPPAGRGDFQPGETIAPQSTTPLVTPTEAVSPPAAVDQPQPVVSDPPVTAPAPAATVPVDTATPASAVAAPAPTAALAPAEANRPLFRPDEEADAAPTGDEFAENEYDEREFSWTASEFIAHHKETAWYLGLAAVTAVVALVVFMITQDYLSAAMTVFGGVIFGISAGHQPRELQYSLDGQGLTIGHKPYPYRNFRSFAIVDEGPFSSITFMPLKRFAPAISIFYDPAAEEQILGVLSNHLPMQDHKHDPVDRLMRRIRF